MQSRKKSFCVKKKKKSSTSNDRGGLKGIFSPFYKFQTQTTKQMATSDSVFSRAHVGSGLSSKEKSYVVCSCQNRSVRYQYLKELAAKAIKNRKIFTMYTSGQGLRKALVERGWVEKIPPHRMSLAKIRQGNFSSESSVHNELERLYLSGVVERQIPNFVWVNKEDHIDPRDVSEATIINKLKIDGLWTTKQGLCTLVRDSHWFHIDDVSEVSCPRTYACDEYGEIDDFVLDFKLTACTSLLKWVLSMVANDRPVFLDCGKIGLNVIVFALNRCKDFLFKKQNRDIDKKNASTATPGQWNVFLKKYYRIIAKEDVFVTDRENKLPLYMEFAKLLLKEIYRIRPQLSCEGCHNIWIIKPSHDSRGRGIRMSSKLGVISDILRKANNKFVIQKYIEEPLLIHDTKFDIRQYYLITNTCPLEIWMYKDCYLKFSSQKYNLNDYHESIHLTNNAVQRKYKNCSDRHPELPSENMWHSDTYKEYLIRIGKEKVWDEIIYPGMKKSIVAVLLACQDQMAGTKNRFELYGSDFVLDKEFKPWLIEINSCPDLSPTTEITAKICPEVLQDIVRVVIDRVRDKQKFTGKFNCIYHQPMTIPRYNNALDLVLRGRSLRNDFFYRGKIHLEGAQSQSCNDRRVRDVNAMMTKLKQIYGRDIMVTPEEYDAVTNKKYRSIGGRKSNEDSNFDGAKSNKDLELEDAKSSEDLKLESTVILDKVNNVELESTVSEISMDKLGEDFIENCLKRAESYVTPTDGVRGLNFSKLDNKSSTKTIVKERKDSIIDAISIHSSFPKSESELPGDTKHLGKFGTEQAMTPNPESVDKQRRVQETDSMFDSIRAATVKLLDFLEKKEQEYTKSRK